MMDNQAYRGDHFAVKTNTESLCYTPEANLMLCQLYKIYTNIKLKQNNDIYYLICFSRKLGEAGRVSMANSIL